MQYKLNRFVMPISVSRIANIHYFEFTEEYQTTDDSHGFCELVYADNGTVYVASEDFMGELSKNQMIIHQPNEVHSLKCAAGSAPNVIIIGFECKDSVLSYFSKNPVTLSVDQQRMLAEVMKEGMSVYLPPYDMPNTLNMKKRESYPFGADQMIKIKLEAFLITLIRDIQVSSLAGEDPLYTDTEPLDVYQYISEHYTEKIVLDNLCFIFGTNKTTLCKDFKQKHGMTILSAVNKMRVKEAKRLLRENRLSASEIAEKLGFTSVHYFYRIFKKTTGQSPNKYKSTIRSKLNL